MDITVRSYGVMSRLLGADSLALSVPEDSTVHDALALLAGRAADGSTTLDRCACAIGDTIVPRSTSLSDGDVLALLPPVAGG